MMASLRPRLVVATSNAGKLAEFRALLPPGVELLSADQAGIELPPETGWNFADIAAQKALSAARQSGTLAIADDSGLEVDALDGAPGIRSHRYAGPSATDAENRAKLLADLSGLPVAARTARFRCAVAIASPQGLLDQADGVCEGTIATEPAGENGFGYDPVFRLANGRTMAQLPSAEKNAISHRARAYRSIRTRLYERLGLTEDAGT
jgi:XTP/dITP diphosphohydrolase